MLDMLNQNLSPRDRSDEIGGRDGFEALAELSHGN